MPVYLVCSESHFSVFFSETSPQNLQKNPVNKDSQDQSIDLIYYDGLANQREFIRISVFPKRSVMLKSSDLVSPLDHCLRTKWPEAYIDWNGTEPLL